jgi:uncharacterized protein
MRKTAMAVASRSRAALDSKSFPSIQAGYNEPPNAPKSGFLSHPHRNLVCMIRLKPDPWSADYGASAEATFGDEGAAVVVDPAVETADWSRAIAPRPCPPEPVTFVDGVMRIDLRVMADDGQSRTWGLFGSYAAGGVRCAATAQFVDLLDLPAGRVLVLGGGMPADPVAITAGNCSIIYEPRSISDDAPHAQRRALQRLMLKSEQRAAAALAVDNLVFADGPLHLNGGPNTQVVGVVKRMVTAYLEGDEAALLSRLRPGERSPVFALGSSILDRYAWYIRLLPLTSQWHELAGLVRCEVRMELGLESACAIANRTACLLPPFAGRPGVDPRAPQNLTPVGALESRLRHRLGHSGVIRRSLLKALSGAAA